MPIVVIFCLFFIYIVMGSGGFVVLFLGLGLWLFLRWVWRVWVTWVKEIGRWFV